MKARPRIGTALLAAVLALVLSAGCGWHLVGTSSGLDPSIKVIAIPVFENRTATDELHQILTDAVVNEFVRRGRHKIVAEPAEADAVLEGTVTRYNVRNTELDGQGRVTKAEVFLLTDLTFRNRAKDQIIWEKRGFLFSQEYDVSQTSGEFLEEEVLAVEDLSDDFASSVVSSILEGF